MNNNFVKKLRIDWENINSDSYLHDIKSIRTNEGIDFNKKITFFVGENGSGKSTLLEAIAVNYGFNPEGGSINYNFETENTHSILSDNMILEKGYRAEDGFFLRAESFYNLASYVDSVSLDLSEYGDKSLHKQSHGESFLSLICNRFRGNGLYILDEPEAALSPQRQLTLISKIKELAREGSQFIIVTHSPIILGIDESEIYSFDNDEISKIDYEDTEAYKITKLFLHDRDRMIKYL
ncbi:MAG: AAA family ATPase [Clostridia bacterium]|jgi:predicted ATPase|nr:AAA family ATPase [Clostridia bacterium]